MSSMKYNASKLESIPLNFIFFENQLTAIRKFSGFEVVARRPVPDT